jgi:hypothetical protein
MDLMGGYWQVWRTTDVEAAGMHMLSRVDVAGY